MSVPLAGWYKVRVVVVRKYFSLLQVDQTSCGTHQAFCSLIKLAGP